MTEKELNKKLAKWVGFQFIRVDLVPFHKKPEDYRTNYWYSSNHWVYPDETKTKGNCPNFTQSLEACFKWLVPKLQEVQGIPYSVDFNFGEGRVVCILHDVSARADTPALALCLVISKLIDGGQK